MTAAALPADCRYGAKSWADRFQLDGKRRDIGLAMRDSRDRRQEKGVALTILRRAKPTSVGHDFAVGIDCYRPFEVH